MLKREHFPQVFGAATLALIFSAASVYPQATTDSGASPGGTSSSTKSSPGSASSGSSSATGQSGASSSAPAAGGSSAASGASDKAGEKAAAGDKSAAAGGLSKSDQNLMRQIAYANLAEIEAGKLAQSKSKNEQVRTFAQQMIDDHTKAQGELQQLADSKGVKLPTEPDSKHKNALKKMNTLSGAAFDKSYMKQGGVSDHQNTHNLLQSAEKKATDPELKALAQKMLPTVDQHLKMAQETSTAKSGAAKASGASGGSDASKGAGGSSTTGK